MKRALLAAVAATAFASTSALAADLPAYGPPAKAPAYVDHAYNWTGAYVGINLGGGWANFAGGSGSSISGFIYGAQIGYNWQAAGSPFVFGLEADFQGSTQSRTWGGVVFANDSVRGRLPWFGTVRGRIGFAFDRALIYATGGLAYQHAKVDWTVPGVGTFTGSSTEAGYTVGGGVEWALWDRWSARGEYLYLNTRGVNATTPAGVTFVTDRVHNHVVRAALNYRF